MGRILFVLALFVITTQCAVLNNEEVAHKRTVRSPCLDCSDRPPMPRLPRPRYLHPYPRFLDYPPPQPPPPPPPPPPYYYPRPGPPPPPSPPFYRHHWHKIINDSDENDDDDGDYNDSASAVSGVTGQSTGSAFSSASAGISDGGSSKYSRYRASYHSGSQYANKGGQSSENFESQTSSSGSGASSNSNAQASTNMGTLSSAGSKSTSQISTSSITGTSHGSAQSTASSNIQLSQTGSQADVSNAQSTPDHNIQNSLSNSPTIESGNPIDAPSSHSLDVQFSGLNQKSSTNFEVSSLEGSGIQSSVFGDHSSEGSTLHSTSGSGSSAVSHSQSSSGTAPSEDSTDQDGKFGSNARSSSLGGSSGAQSNAQSVNGQGNNIASGFNAKSSDLGDQSSLGLNIQSFNLSSVGQSQSQNHSSFAHQISLGSNTESSNNGGFLGKYQSGYGLTSDNANAPSSVSYHPTGKFDKQYSNNPGSSSYESVHSGSSGFESQSPVDFKPLYSDSFNDSPSVSSSFETKVSRQPIGLGNHAYISNGGSSIESSNSQFTRQKSLENINRQASNTFGDLPSSFEVQSSLKSSPSFSKPSSNNFATSSSQTYHKSFGGQSNKFNLQSFENGGSSEESKPQPVGNRPEEPIINKDKSFEVPTQSNTFSHKPSSIDDSQSPITFGNNFGLPNTQSSTKGFGDQTLGFDTQKSNNVGRLSFDKFAFQQGGSDPSDIPKLQPGDISNNPSKTVNNQYLESFSKLSTEGSSSQSQSNISRHTFSTNEQVASNDGITFGHSDNQYGLNYQAGGVNGHPTEHFGDTSSKAGNAQSSNANHEGSLDQSLKTLNGASSKDFGQFSTETINQSPKNLNSESPKIYSNGHGGETSASADSQSSFHSFDRTYFRRGDVPPSQNQIQIPLTGPTSVGNSDNSGQERREFKSYEYHKGRNTGSTENVQQSSSSENVGLGLDKPEPATDLSGLTASGLRKSFRDIELRYPDSSYDLSLEKPNTDFRDYGVQSSANLNGQSINTFEGSDQFSDQKKQSFSNFGRGSSPKSEATLSSISNSPNGSTIMSNVQSNFAAVSSSGNKRSNGFNINSATTNTQSSSNFGELSSQDSNMHSFSISDQMCVCGPKKSALLNSISKYGAFNGFDSHSSGSKAQSSSGINSQSSEGSLGSAANDQTTGNQIKDSQTSFKNGDGNIASYGVQLSSPNFAYGKGSKQIDSSENIASSDGSNNNGLNSASDGLSPLPTPSTPPNTLLHPPLGPPPQYSPPAISLEANSIPSTVLGNIGNNNQRKADMESQHYQYQENMNTDPFTDQQQTSDFGGSGSGVGGGSSTIESEFTSSGSKGGNNFGIPGSIHGERSFGSGSSSSGAFTYGFGVHGSINEQGYPNGYGAGHLGTQSLSSPPYNLGPQGPKTSEGGQSSYALSNARSKNGDAIAMSTSI